MAGSAFAAKELITGADIKNGSITRADLSRGTVSSLKGKRGPAGRDGFTGARGPQGDTGPQGPAGPAGPVGPQGPRGGVGDTGVQGPTGRTGPVGPRGDQGPQGAPGQSVVYNTAFGPTDPGTLASTATGPSTDTEGTELTGGFMFLSPGQYKVDYVVTFADASAADAGAEYGAARLFLDASPLDGATSSAGGGGSVGDTLLVTSDVQEDGSPAQASGAFIVNVGDNGSGGETLNLRAVVRTDEADSANVSGSVIVTRIG
ncbi:MAG TPA: hypothetical protein VFS37_13750 [Conexibacter sp.]|nr:hypothetical protein [Conexibacter sp.]